MTKVGKDGLPRKANFFKDRAIQTEKIFIVGKYQQKNYRRGQWSKYKKPLQKRTSVPLWELAVLILLVIAFTGAALVHRWENGLYFTASGAQSHCPTDMVVWLNLHSMVYHFPGDSWYNNTVEGAYTCERSAIAQGARTSGWKQY